MENWNHRTEAKDADEISQEEGQERERGSFSYRVHWDVATLLPSSHSYLLSCKAIWIFLFSLS